MKLEINDNNPKEENEEQVFSLNSDNGMGNETGIFRESKGGTENMYHSLMNRLDDKYKDKFQIICSRVRTIREDRIPIMWFHDTWNDPENQFLQNPSIKDKFKKFVFVSNHQFTTYNITHGINFGESVVIKNAIVPIEYKEKLPTKNLIKLIYHTTPHRGLELLVPCFIELCKHFDNLHLDIYSSFEIYGWKHRDTEYEQLFEVCRTHPKITYHGFQPNDVVRKALQEAHIFAYPSIWPETSCIAAIEALSAGCIVVAPDYGSLPETLGPYGYVYRFHEDPKVHANRFASYLASIINAIEDIGMRDNLKNQVNFFNNMYDWNNRIREWEMLFDQILTSDKKHI